MHRHYFVEGKTLPEAYHKSLVILEQQGDVGPCDYDTNMKEVGMTFFVEDAIAEPFISKLFPGGHYELQQYTMEIVDGILNFKVGEELTWSYTYNLRFAHQLPFIYEELRRNPQTRRAIMNIRDFESDSHHADPACLQSIHFLIRDGRLHQKVMMRSNDAVQATYMNAVGFIALQRKMAKDLGCEVGSYTHTANSFHAYERSFPLLKRYAADILGKDHEALTYEYEGFYKDLMEESIPKIMRQVDTLKKELAASK